MATGTGKTSVLAEWLRRVGPMGTLGVMHREELIDQARERILLYNPGVNVGIEKASERSAQGDEVVLASVQTVGRAGSDRLLPQAWLRNLWIDEAHHAPADSYLRVASHFGLRGGEATPVRRDATLIGTTATPERLDGLGHDTLFDDVVFRYDLPEAIKDGWLADVRAWRIESSLDLSSVSSSGGDYAKGSLAKAIAQSNLTAQAAKTWSEQPESASPAIFFCVTKEHAGLTADALAAQGARAAVVTDETPARERAMIVRAFQDGEIDCLCNVGVFTEGFDAPNTRSIYILRPTKSRSLYMQMLGRGTRLAPSKECCTLFDFTPGEAMAAGPGDIFGLPDAWQCQGQSLLNDKTQLDLIQQELPLDLSSATSIADLRSTARRIQLFRSTLTDNSLSGAKLAWFKAPGREHWRIGWRNPTPQQLEKAPDFVRSKFAQAGLHRDYMGMRESLEIIQNEIGAWEVHYRNSHGQAYRFAHEPSLRGAVAVAEARISNTRPHVVGLLRRDRSWRAEPASEKQKPILRRKGVPEPMVAIATKAEASMLMDMERSEIEALFPVER
jgi:hypothetical protein